ncbi:hypothetical protein [Nocardia crassostreae]|uniref:hypothetical protein n=1 Tax=Nocardia crassostreae TaxID=53428 RepID=UPI000835854F|nr:hypothetical protein [Nocardia crassostreae]
MSAAVIFHILDDGTEVITFPRLNWALVVATATLLQGFAIAVLLVVSTANFDEAPPVPSVPAACDPFCPKTS